MIKPALPVLLLLLPFWMGCDSGREDFEETNDPALNLVVQGQQTSGDGVQFHFAYDVPVESIVTLGFFDDEHKELQRLVNERQQIGKYSILLDASAYPEGTYRYRLQAEPTDGTRVLVSTGKLEISR